VLADPFGHVLVLQVEDSGPGIPEAERELVLQPFYRALGTNVDGSGLGLPIVLEIARQHQAEIKLEDAHPGHVPPGTRVSVRFVLDEEETAREAATAQAGLETFNCSRSRSIARATGGSCATRCASAHSSRKPCGS
jgi:two-component system sensor histidine kinase TctE